jgi:tetratricopeptide (TPR) repeat protein
MRITGKEVTPMLRTITLVTLLLGATALTSPALAIDEATYKLCDAVITEGSQHYAGKLRESINACTKVIKSNPKNHVAYNNRGSNYDDLKQYDKALADYNMAAQINPRYAKSHFNMGNTHRHTGDLDSAIADYTRAIQIDPNYSMAYNNRGVVYSMKDELKLALADFRKAILLDPQNMEAVRNAGKTERQISKGK